ncbi:hypothetical protein ACWZJV_04650 [Nocardioides sp. WG-D5]|uniref:hypothetical protein n=1 Tax=Nocardioides luteus TaxID=1844 RepID=UPI000202920B|nr:hypothetical protein [Nocardioides luteus]EGD43779.1 hypothetical protein NBCG_01906 [Nocardioidaceae bacterium Broad-1]MBG6095620.1 hypothetical protein [Nocardioides luteus]
MVTDIYGGIEIRDPWPDDANQGWIKAIDLFPLLEDGGPAGAYPAYAFLFGVRNEYGFSPIAEARGLPADVAASTREYLQPELDYGQFVVSWLLWSEVKDLDLDGPFGHIAGQLEWNDGASFWISRLIPAEVESGVLAFAGEPASSLNLAEATTWQHNGVTYRYRPMTLGSYFGDGTPWGHVFAVMSALAGRFGDEGVRLVAGFD